MLTAVFFNKITALSHIPRAVDFYFTTILMILPGT